MFSVDWLCFEKIIELMEKEFNGYMTYRDAVFFAGLPRHYRGNVYFPEFLKHKVIVMLPEGEDEQLYILRKDR
jgi:hypothetical protein|tara:strand:+ start:68 stop:286 length:219 start_codon:yes stop_codon:yes gene_type:complete